MFSFCSVPTAQALESVEWPGSPEERNDIQKPAPTIELEDSSSHRAHKELMPRLKAEEGIPRHERDNDTEIRQARPYYRLGKLFEPNMRQRNGPAQQRIEERRHNATSSGSGHPSQHARSTSREPPETTNRKRIHHPDANSNMSKAQKRAHGNSPSSPHQGTAVPNLNDSASRVSAGKESAQHGERSQGKRRELPWERE